MLKIQLYHHRNYYIWKYFKIFVNNISQHGCFCQYFDKIKHKRLLSKKKKNMNDPKLLNWTCVYKASKNLLHVFSFALCSCLWFWECQAIWSWWHRPNLKLSLIFSAGLCFVDSQRSSSCKRSLSESKYFCIYKSQLILLQPKNFLWSFVVLHVRCLSGSLDCRVRRTGQ